MSRGCHACHEKPVIIHVEFAKDESSISWLTTPVFLVTLLSLKVTKPKDLDTTQISDAHKQARFRRKEQLKRDADKIYRSREGSPARWRSKRAPEEVRHALDKMVELSSGWTDEDYRVSAR